MNDHRNETTPGRTRRAAIGAGAVAATAILTRRPASAAQDPRASRIVAFALDQSTVEGADFGAVFEALVARGGGSIHVPAGIYPIGRTLKAEVNAPISIIGDGIFATKLVFSNGNLSDGFQIGGTFTGQTGNFASLEVQNLSILKSGTGGSAMVLRCTAGNGASAGSYPHFRVDNAYFSGVNHDVDHWEAGITLDRAVHGTITRCRFRGLLTDVDRGMLHGILAEGYVGEVYISKCFFESMTWAIRNRAGEGVTIDDCHMVNVLIGVQSDSGPLLIVSNCHINAHTGGVKAVATNSTIVRHNLFYHREGAARFCNMVEIVGSAEAVIDGNIFVDASANRMNSIVVTCNTGVVTANLLSPSGRDRVDSGLWVRAGSVDVRAFGNRFFGKITTDPGVDPATRAMIVD